MAEKRMLLAQPSQTKKSLVDTLVMMKNSGRLEEGATKRELQEAIDHHFKQKNTHGTVVQKISKSYMVRSSRLGTRRVLASSNGAPGRHCDRGAHRVHQVHQVH